MSGSSFSCQHVIDATRADAGDLACHPALVRLLAEPLACMSEFELRQVEARTLVASGVDLLPHTWPLWFSIFVRCDCISRAGRSDQCPRSLIQLTCRKSASMLMSKALHLAAPLAGPASGTEGFEHFASTHAGGGAKQSQQVTQRSCAPCLRQQRRACCLHAQSETAPRDLAQSSAASRYLEVTGAWRLTFA